MKENKEKLNLRKGKVKMDEKSIKSIQEYNKSIKEWNIKMHKICISLLIFVNLCLFIFLILYKYQIYTLTTINANKSKEITIEEDLKKNMDIKTDHMLVNILTSIGLDYYFSFFFKNENDINRVKDILLTTPGFDATNRDQIHPLLLFTASYEQISTELFREKISWLQNILIVIETANNKRFGVYWGKEIDNDGNNGTTIVKDEYAFMFSLDTGKKYMIKKNAEYAVNIPLNGDVLFNVGNGDLIVTVGSFTGNSKSTSKFPVSYESNGEVSNPFTTDGEINIMEFEVYTFMIYDY